MEPFDRLLKYVAATFVVALLGTVTTGIVSRALNHPLTWTEEGSSLLMVWLACLGWMLAGRHHSHIRIRFFLDLLPVTPKRSAEILLQLAVAVFGGVIAWFSVHLILTNADIEATTLPLSVAWMYVPLLPAGLLTLGQALFEAWSLSRASIDTGRGEPT